MVPNLSHRLVDMFLSGAVPSTKERNTYWKFNELIVVQNRHRSMSSAIYASTAILHWSVVTPYAEH